MFRCFLKIGIKLRNLVFLKKFIGTSSQKNKIFEFYGNIINVDLFRFFFGSKNSKLAPILFLLVCVFFSELIGTNKFLIGTYSIFGSGYLFWFRIQITNLIVPIVLKMVRFLFSSELIIQKLLT